MYLFNIVIGNKIDVSDVLFYNRQMKTRNLPEKGEIISEWNGKIVSDECE